MSQRKIIEQRFRLCLYTLECIIDIDNPIKSMIVSGAPGVGKTYNILKRLKEAEHNLLCNVSYMNGKSTTIGLLTALWKTKNIGDILVLDDIDSVFNSEDTLNLLKAALDSSDTRTITYASSSKVLKDAGIPQQFEFQGKVIFITNLDLNKKASSLSSQSVHYNAIMSRSVYIDLDIHSTENIMIHINNVMSKTNILSDIGISTKECEEILDFMNKNVSVLKERPSLRLPIKIAGYVKQYPYDWKEICSTLLLRS